MRPQRQRRGVRDLSAPPPSFTQRYESALAEHGWQADPAQAEAVRRLEALEQRLCAAQPAPDGLVGRGLRLLGDGRGGPRL